MGGKTMQVYDDENNLIMSKLFKQEEELLKAHSQEIKKKETNFIVTGKFPRVGDKVKVNGLSCSVIMSNDKKKRFTLEMD